MKKNILIIFLLIFATSCKSQTISLEAAAQCLRNSNCPEYNYAKDINNSLQKFIGTWKGSYNGKTYELKFNKSLYEDFGIKRDQITGRLQVKNSDNIIEFSNFGELDDNKTKIFGLNFQPDLQSYRVHFTGNSPKGCINSGIIYIRVKNANLNEMHISYLSDKDIVSGDCPSNFFQTFPEKQSIILTKQ